MGEYLDVLDSSPDRWVNPDTLKRPSLLEPKSFGDCAAETLILLCNGVKNFGDGGRCRENESGAAKTYFPFDFCWLAVRRISA